MRAELDVAKLRQFMIALGNRLCGAGTICLTGDATAVLYAWRTATIDVALNADPGPAGLLEAIAALKDELDVNVELVSPDRFIPALPAALLPSHRSPDRPEPVRWVRDRRDEHAHRRDHHRLQRVTERRGCAQRDDQR